VIGIDRRGPRLNILRFISAYKDLHPVAFAMVSDADDLRIVAPVTFPDSFPKSRIVAHGCEKGFYELKETVKMLLEEPQIVAKSNFSIKTERRQGTGGLIDHLFAELLDLIHKSVMVPLSLDNGSLEKPVWGIEGDAGLIMGLVCGKAAQMGIQLPFPVDPEFFELLANPEPRKIAEYYFKIYRSEIENFKSLRLLQNPKWRDIFELEVLACTSPNHLQFANLFQSSDIEPIGESVVVDFVTMSKPPTVDTIVEDYFGPLNEKILEQFTLFVQNFRRNFALTFRVDGLRYLQNMAFVSDMFDPKPPKPEDVLNAIRYWDEDCDENFKSRMVDSLVPGHTISSADVFKSFVMALTPNQLAKLVAVWTGSSLLHLTEKTLHCSFMSQHGHQIFWLITQRKTEAPPRQMTIYYWMTPEQRRAHAAGEKVVLTAEQQPRSPMGALSKVKGTRCESQSRQTLRSMGFSVGLVSDLDNDSNEEDFSEDEITMDNPNGAEIRSMGFSVGLVSDLDNGSNEEDFSEGEIMMDKLNPIGEENEGMERDGNRDMECEGSNPIVKPEKDDDVEAHISIRDGIEFMEFIRRVAAIQHEMVKAEGVVVDPFEVLDIHDGESPTVLVYLCDRNMRIPLTDNASVMLHALVTILNSRLTDIADY
jgi:hypothetical protein